MQKGGFDEAARMYQELVRAVPGDAGLLMNLGMALAMGGHEAEAIGPLERAIKLKPALVPAHLFLGSSYLALGEAARRCRRSSERSRRSPANVEYRRLLARAYVESDRPLDAVAELRPVTELAPKLPAAWYALFTPTTTWRRRRFASSRRSGSEAMPGEQALATICWSRMRLADGRFADAFGVYRETLEALPSMVTIRDSIARIYEQTGHRDWAAIEREKGRLSEAQCAKRRALCAFRAGRYRAALTAAGTGDGSGVALLAGAGGNRADERGARSSRQASRTRASVVKCARRWHRRSTLPRRRARTEGGAAVRAQGRGLIGQLGTALYLSREYEPALEVLGPVVEQAPASEDVRVLTAYGDSLLQMDRVEDAVRYLRRAFTADTSDRARVPVAGARLHPPGDFAAALPLLEWQLAGDTDGSVHVLLRARSPVSGRRTRRKRCSRSPRRSSGRRSSGPKRRANERSRRRNRFSEPSP